MKNIVIYGAPAAGKGTVCEELVKNYGYEHISTGQLFRELSDNTPLGVKVKKIMESGNLVDDETTVQVLKEKLETLDGHIVLDGFPRNVKQAQILDSFFDNYIVINLDVDYDIARRRILGRLMCSKCGKIYNELEQEKKPKVKGICDECGVSLTKRKDDNEESFKKRFQIHQDSVKNILSYYEKKNILYTISSKNPQQTFEEIESVIK